MNHLTTYQANSLRTEKKLPTPQERYEHALLGLVTEVGEITTEVKRMAIYGKPLDDARREHIAEEIGDVMWYLAIAADVIGLDLFNVPAADHDFPAEAGFKEISLVLARINGNLIEELMVADVGDDLSPKVGTLLLMSGTCLWHLARLISTPLDQIAGENIAKLRERFPDAYSDEAAEARADKGGLDARNS